MITTDDIKRLRQEPTPDNVRAQLDRLQLTQQEGAALLRINERTMRRYLQEPGTSGAAAMPFSSFALLRLAKRGER